MKRLRHVANFRDLGGIRSSDGRVIEPGRLYRSGHLARLEPAGGDAMRERFGIRAVADLRSDSEVEEKPDATVHGVRYCPLPPLTDEQNPSINRHNRRAILKKLAARADGTRGYLRQTYRTLVSSPMALAAYGNVLRLLLETPEGGVLWHCTQGKDRAGVGTAVVLMALGVPREEIVRDYMRSNSRLRLRNTLIFIGVLLITFNFHLACSLHSLLTARREYIQAAFDELDARYGGTDGFLHEGLGMTDNDLARLRALCLG